MQEIVFLGAAHAFMEIIEIIKDINAATPRYGVVAILDDNEALHGTEIDGVPVCGPLEQVHQYPLAKFVFGIGSYKTRLVRHQIIQRLGLDASRFETLIHPSCKIYPDVSVGHGCLIYPGVTICAGAQISAFSIITFDTVIAPQVTLKPFAMVTTMCCILTGATIGHSAFIGVRSVVGEGVRIGCGSVVVMGSVVFQGCEDGALLQGNPAKLVYRVPCPNIEEHEVCTS